MDEKPLELEFSGLEPVDILELEELLPEGSVKPVPSELTATSYGEPVTLAVVVTLAALSIPVVALYIVTKREKTSFHVSHVTEVDGQKKKEKFDVKFQTSSSQPPDTQLVVALNDLHKQNNQIVSTINNQIVSTINNQEAGTDNNE